MALTLNNYQLCAMGTCKPESNNIVYMLTNLVGEVGEFCSKIGKARRKGYISINNNKLDTIADIHTLKAAELSEDDLKKEAGDILWQLAGLCQVMGWKLEEVAELNLTKLASRQQRGVIDGNGDNR